MAKISKQFFKKTLSVFLALLTTIMVMLDLNFEVNATGEVTEHFSDDTAGANTFTNGVYNFNLTGGRFVITNYAAYGWTGTDKDDYYVDNYGNYPSSAGVIGSIKISNGKFNAHQIYIFPGEDGDYVKNTGNVIIRGKLNNTQKFEKTVASGDINTSGVVNNAFTYVDLSSYSNIIIDELEFEVTGALRYLALDAFKFTPIPLAPTVSSVSVPSSVVPYKAGSNLDFTVNFSETVTVTGTPQLSLDIGGSNVQANYISGTGTSAIKFRYTVQDGDTDADGISVGTLGLNSGTIKNSGGTDANLTLNNVGSTANAKVDTTIPTITSVTVPSNGTYKAGDELQFTVNFSEATFLNGNVDDPLPYLTLTIGGSTVQADFNGGSGGTALRFHYIVQSGDNDSDGIEIGSNVTSSVRRLFDYAFNDANLTLNNVGSTIGIKIDTTPPTVTDANISISGATGTGGRFKTGDTVTATWDNTPIGDNNDDVSTVTANFSAFGGGAAVVANNNAGTWTAAYTIVAGAIESTNLNVSITATDNAGNSATTAGTTNATVDNQAPNAPSTPDLSDASDTGVSSTDNITTDTTPTFSGTAETGSTVTLISSVNGNIGTGTATGGNWSITSSALAGGNHTITATATDSAGNVSASSTGLAITIITNAPTVTTQAVTDVTTTTATGNGNVTSLGDINPTAYGVCWNTTGTPTISDNKTDKGGASSTGAFTSTITGLSPNTTYYVRAYATNEVGTTYGAQVSFTTIALKYTVTFDSNDGSAVSPITDVTSGTTITAPTAPTRTGYTFGGWYEDDNTFTDAWNFASDIVTVNTTLYAKWTANVYNITYNLDGGTNDPANTATYTYATGLTLQNPTKTGYTFGGWYDNASFTGSAITSISTTDIGDKTLYAKWAIITSAPTATTNAATSISISSATLNGTVNANNANTTVTFEYGITLAYGTTVTADQSPVTGGSNTAVSAVLSGLSPNAMYHYRVVAVNSEGTTYGADMTFTTNPIPKYTVSFDSNGGTAVSSISDITSGSTILAPTAPTRTGYTFGGWYTDNNTFLNSWNFATDTVTADTTLFAKWTANSYGITYNLNGGTNNGSNTATYNYGTGLTLQNPTKTGYAFGGWYDNASFTGSAITSISTTDNGDKTFYAKWIAVPTPPAPTPDPTPTPETKTVEVIETPKEIKNPEKIEIKPNGDAFDKSVEVRLKDDPEVQQIIKESLDKEFNEELKDATIFPLDISLYVKGTDTKVQPNEGTSVTITCPIPESLLAEKDSVKVVCIIDSELTVLETKVIEIDGVWCAEFTANHFSPYAMVVDASNVLNNIDETATTQNPKTGDNSATPISIIAILSVAIIAVVSKKRKFKVVK